MPFGSKKSPAASDVHTVEAAKTEKVAAGSAPQAGPVVTLRRPKQVRGTTSLTFSYNFEKYSFPYDTPIQRPGEDVIKHILSLGVKIEW